MNYLILGQLSIPITWLAFILAILYSDFRNKHADHFTNKRIEQLVWVYLFIWKFSYILFSWNSFMKAPLSLLYFDGGKYGHLLALTVMIVLLYRNKAELDWQVLWVYWARFVAVFNVISYTFLEQWLLVIIWFGVWLLLERNKWKLVLLVEWLLIFWQAGWGDSILLAHGVVLLTFILTSKQFHQFATITLLTLLALMLTDIEITGAKSVRVAIDLPTTTGEYYTLEDQTQSLTVVNFFATWCPPCKAEMPHLQKFAENLPENVEIVGVNLTSRDHGQDALNKFVETYNVTYPILLDMDDSVGKSFQVTSIPTTVLLNKNGEEIDRIIGPISEHALRVLVNKYDKQIN